MRFQIKDLLLAVQPAETVGETWVGQPICTGCSRHTYGEILGGLASTNLDALRQQLATALKK